MDLGILFFVVLATAAPLLLSMAQPLNYSMAKPSTLWINKVRLGLEVQPILTPSPQREDYLSFGPAFAAGFVCASSTPACDVSLFAVFLARTDTGGAFDPRVVWSANRDRPVRMNATLEFTKDGILVLRDSDGSHVWSSSGSSHSIAGMLITEIGNLVLVDHMNATVWQSFDHPTDTMVPGQSLMEGMMLTASTSAENTTENQLYITIRKDGVYFYAGSAPPQLYAAYTFLVPDHKKENYPTTVTFMNGNISIFVQSEMSGNITMPATKSAQFMRLESDGHLRLHEWVNTEWIMYDIMHMNDCAYPTVCGDYGICSEGQCTCPQQNYFMQVDKQTPNLGCAPTTPISCQEIRHHQLLAIPDISYFDKNPTIVNATSIDDCKQSCLKNCSCRAVMFSYHQNDSNGECEWVTEVFSLQSIQPGTIGYSSSAYLKVQVIPSNSNKGKVTLGATLGAIATLVLLVIVVTLYVQRRRKYEDKDEAFDLDQLPGMPVRFSFQKLSECTEGFSNKLGEGGFGSVFEGKLGEERVAVKRLEGSRQGKKEFLAEIETIGSIEHINLVRLIGFCAEKSQRLLVYEYMTRGSLDRWIYYHHNNAPLDWCTRCRIILDIAKGLCYLHEECRRKIAHLDIKPQNILLDDNFNAKVADFGLCKLIDRDQSKVMTMMRGTPGYMAPEWLTSPITEKVDVYSFGVVIMEIISGRKNIDNTQPEDDVHLINLLREKDLTNQLIDLIDKNSDDMISSREEVIKMMKLAVWCLQNDSTRRPSMPIVIKVLEGAMSIETFDANSIMFVQDNPLTYSAPSQASVLSGPSAGSDLSSMVEIPVHATKLQKKSWFSRAQVASQLHLGTSQTNPSPKSQNTLGESSKPTPAFFW